MIRLPNSILCFFIKKNWTNFVSCARAGLVGNIGKFFFPTFPHFLGNQTESQQAEPQKKLKLSP